MTDSTFTLKVDLHALCHDLMNYKFNDQSLPYDTDGDKWDTFSDLLEAKIREILQDQAQTIVDDYCKDQPYRTQSALVR